MAEQEPEQAEDHRRPWQPPAYAAEEASRLQKLYRANRDKAVRQVLREETPPCPVPGEQLAAHFAPPPCPPVEWDRRPQEVPDLTPAAPSPALTAPFRADEVVAEARRDAARLLGSPLAPWQKLDAEADILLAAATQRLLHSRDPAVAELAAAELSRCRPAPCPP
ncbi:hypothetical protein FJT64_008762 [Amphibalanus amphitrite]|uniref:Uncharacterized protein n=1 Tax=Amphibalanus amphitrite TaxID=1232801 RepID=A0A6A4VIL8_AMPAM|nr:hypothetical protein FJT64_008762 [Amphibalanus amphitrite]